MEIIRVFLDRFEDDKAVLILPDGQNLFVSRGALEEDLMPGDCLDLHFKKNKKYKALASAKAKNLLKKIFNKNT